MRECIHGCNSLGEILFKGEWVKCPIHGIEKEVKLKAGEMLDGTNLYDRLKIPEDYEGEWVDGAIDRLFRVEGVEHCTATSINRIRAKISDIFMRVAVDREVPRESVYIYGAMVDINPWAYSLQRVALEQGMETYPIVSINDLAGLVELQEYAYIEVKGTREIKLISQMNRLAGQGAEWSLYTGTDYVSYLHSDLCIVSDSAITTEKNIRTLGGFLEERARRNKSTIVVSSVFPNIHRRNLENKGLRNRGKLDFYMAETTRVKAKEVAEQNRMIISKPEVENKYDLD